MLEEENKFDLVPVIDKETGNYVIKDYDNVTKIVDDYVATALKATEVIGDDIAFSEAKKVRTDIRKHKEAITQARIHINALLLGTFNEQLKTIETKLDSADKEIKTKVDTYNTEVKGKLDNKPKVITLTVKGYDAKAIEKVKALAVKCGLSAEVK